MTVKPWNRLAVGAYRLR